MKRILTLLACVAVVTVVLLTAVRFAPGIFSLKTESEDRDSQLINSISRQEQVVLLSLGIQGISERNEKSQFFGVDVPGSSRASFIQYSFHAKLGIDGADVRLAKTGDSAYTVSIPEFIFIGHDDVSFRLAAEKNGALSWVTPKIDSVEMINNILNDDARAEYVDTNLDVLTEQAKVFYTGIITGIDPSVDIRFEFLRSH